MKSKLLQLALAVVILMGSGAFIYHKLHKCPEQPVIETVVMDTLYAPVDSNKIIADARYGWVKLSDIDIPDDIVISTDSSDADSVQAVFTSDTIDVEIDSLDLTMKAHVDVTTILTDKPMSLIDLTFTDIVQTKNDTVAFILQPAELQTEGYEQWYKNHPQSMIIGACGSALIIVGGVVIANALANIGG
jgi:hypothetical protein